MPKRTSKRTSFEAESEREPLTRRMQRQLRRLTLERAPVAIEKLEGVASEEDRFYALPGAAVAAFNLERYDLAEQLARSLLDLATSFERNWNHGNAIHFAHTVLGLLAVRQDELLLGIQELKASGETSGSPQLGSFGPSMQLAKELLKHGEFGSVLSYFQQCRVFWKMGGAWLDIWERKVRAGSVPNFVMHSYR
ncbi:MULTISPECIES: hypothetical protein [unclassified Variovorax]|uniref:hypothetical protein n=1 Tax=unclassified Variovorax TaxID=663243 RepID=UPI003ED13C44